MTEEDGRLFVAPTSPALGAATGLAWLWRLGPILRGSSPRAVGVGVADEARELDSLVRAGRLAGAVVFAGQPGPGDRTVPARRKVAGVAEFGPRTRLDGDFTVLDGGDSLVRSSLGVHAAVMRSRTLVIGADVATAWTVIRQYWVLEALARFLPERLERPLVLLPAVGCVRLDDAPGTAQHQAQGDARSDRRQVKRVRDLARRYGESQAVLNLAVAARALDADGRTEIPLEQQWPRAVAAMSTGVSAGTFEPVGHGYLHLDCEALDRGVIEFREFARLGESDAGRLIDAVFEWQEKVLGRRPGTFVAPAWSYSAGTHRALAARHIPAWLRPTLGPLRTHGAVHETVASAFRGLRGLDLAPLVSLAAHGLPPTPVFHGGLFDLRLQQLRASRDVRTLARLVVRRDIERLPGLAGIRWIGAGAFLQLLDAHASVSVRGSEVYMADAPGSRLVGGSGTRG